MTQHSRPARFARLRVFLTALCFAGTADVLAAPMVYVPDSSTGKIAIVDSANGAMTGEIVTGRDPRGIAIHPDGNTLYIGNFEGKSLSIIDALSQQEKANIPLAQPGSGCGRQTRRLGDLCRQWQQRDRAQYRQQCHCGNDPG
jgi:YVTN family beta-propeller protein